MSNTKADQANSLANHKPMMIERAQLHMDKKDIEDEIKNLDKILRPVLEGRGKVQVDNFTMEVKVVAGRKTQDKVALEAFLAEHGKTLEDFTVMGAPYTTFSVSEAQVV